MNRHWGGAAHKNFGLEQSDWLSDEDSFSFRAYAKIYELYGDYPNRLKPFSFLVPKLYEKLAWGRFRRGIQLLSRYETIITDRLHGHILSVLLGKPHVCLDNANGKVRNFYETWTKNCDLVRWASSIEEAVRLAQSSLSN